VSFQRFKALFRGRGRVAVCTKRDAMNPDAFEELCTLYWDPRHSENRGISQHMKLQAIMSLLELHAILKIHKGASLPCSQMQRHTTSKLRTHELHVSTDCRFPAHHSHPLFCQLPSRCIAVLSSHLILVNAFVHSKFVSMSLSVPSSQACCC
jgi:hypothetical protein